MYWIRVWSMEQTLIIIIGLLLISTMIAAVGSLFLKLGAAQFVIPKSLLTAWHTLKNWRLILGLALYVFGTVFFILALRLGKLSMIFAMTSLSYVFVTVLSALFLHERINGYKLAGVALIVVGVVLVAV